MPVKKGRSRKTVSKNIRELHQGPQYQRTRRKFGKKKADKQAVAIALGAKHKSTRKRRAKKK